MPDGGRGHGGDALTSGMVRELLEEFRSSLTEVLSLRNEVHDLKGSMDELVKAIRGGNGYPGLASGQLVLENRLQTLERAMQDTQSNGTPHSRAGLGLIEQRMAVNEHRIMELEQQHEKGISRTWQVVLFAGTSLLSLAGSGIALASLFLKK